MRSNKSSAKANRLRNGGGQAVKSSSNKNSKIKDRDDSPGTLDLNHKAATRMVLFQNICPPRVATKLKYLVTAVLNNAGFAVASRQMRANGIYDVDPAVASTAVPGFNEWMTLYDRFRVFKTKTDCQIVNRETFPYTACLSMEPLVYAPNTKGIAFFESSISRPVVLAATGDSSRQRIVISRTAGDVVGDELVYTDLGYTGTSGANPISLYYSTVAIDTSPLGAVFTVGAFIRWELTFWVEFYERRNLNA